MEELKLLYTYEEWKDKKVSFESIGEDTARLLFLQMKTDRTDEEEKECKELREKTDKDIENRKYTDTVHRITSLYNELKNIHDNDNRRIMYEYIGKLQCLIEIMKETNNKK